MAPSHTVYPVLPLKSTVLFPHILMPVAVGRPHSVSAAEAALALEDKMLVAAVQRDPQTQAPDLPDLYPCSRRLRQHPISALRWHRFLSPRKILRKPPPCCVTSRS